MATEEEKAEKSPVKKKTEVDQPACKANSVKGDNNIDSRTEKEKDLAACKAESVAGDTNLSTSLGKHQTRKGDEKVNAEEEDKKATDQAKIAGAQAHSLKGNTNIERPEIEKALPFGKANIVAGFTNVSKPPERRNSRSIQT